MRNTTKCSLRQAITAQLAAVGADERAEWDRHLLARWRAEQARRWPAGIAAAMAYDPLPDEPDLRPLLGEWLAAGVRLVLPVWRADGGLEAREVGNLERDLVADGVRADLFQPAAGCPLLAPDELDLILVPGRAFAPTGTRLGRGRGCYDRFLASLACQKAALAYDCQMREEVPREAHDCGLDLIVTPTRTWECSA